MIHLSAIDASRLLGNNPKAKAVVNKVKKAQQAAGIDSREVDHAAPFTLTSPRTTQLCS